MSNLIKIMVSKLRCHKQKTSFEHIHGCGNRYSVKILQLDLGDHVLVGLEGDLEDVPLLGLHQEEEHALGLVGGGTHENHSSFRIV